MTDKPMEQWKEAYSQRWETVQYGNIFQVRTIKNGWHLEMEFGIKDVADYIRDALNFALLRDDIVRFIRGVVPLDTDDPRIKHDIIAKLEALDGK